MSKIGKLREELLKLLSEHHRDQALPTSARFLFYELVARGLISKERKTTGRRPDQDMNDALTDLRKSGDIPWNWIIDETRSLDDYSGSTSIKDGVLNFLPGARLDPWTGKTILVLTESRSLAGVLRDLAYKYAIQIASTNGQCGGFLHTTIAPLLEDALPVVLYLGDYDLAGNQIEENSRRVLEKATAAVLDWERIALNLEQVEQYQLPTIQKNDRRYKDRGGHEAVETEALSQTLIVELLQTRLNELLPEPLAAVHEREEQQRQLIRDILLRTPP
jgi:hypothetical protein